MNLMAEPNVKPNAKDDYWHQPLRVLLDSPDLVSQQIEDADPTLWSSNIGHTEFLLENDSGRRYPVDPDTGIKYISQVHYNFWF